MTVAVLLFAFEIGVHLLEFKIDEGFGEQRDLKKKECSRPMI